MLSTDPEAQTMLAPAAADSVEGDAETLAMQGTGAPEPTKKRGKRRKKSFTPLARGSALGRYVVLDQLGAGGMGVVYAAYDPELDRRIAIKLLQTEEGAPDDATAGHARLLREAQAMAKLTHPNVIAVYDVGSFEDSVFVAMEFVDGTTITAHLDELWEDGPPPWRDVVALYAGAGRGLAAAHAAGVVHRDFKPDNVMVGEDGRVLVLDFGLARPTGEIAALSNDASLTGGELEAESSPRVAVSTGPLSQLTKTGTVMGTPAYMSPEQMKGKATDAPTDQFSFCVALYQGLYGERPFAGDTFADLTNNVLRGRFREPPRKTKVPQWLRRALLRGLERKPEDRFPSMAALLAAIGRDPAKRRGQVALGTLGVALLGGAAVAGVRIGKGEDVCAQAAVALKDIWTPGRRATIDGAFESVGKAYAQQTYDKLAPALDQYAVQWASQRQDACMAARVRGEQSDEVMGLRMACLDQRLHRFDTLVEILESADATIAADSLSKVHGLPRLADCADVEALRSDVPPPDDPQTREQVDEIRLELQRAVGLSDGGRFDEGQVIMEALLRRAEALDYPPIEAEVLIYLAELAGNRGDSERAGTLTKRGLLIAEATGFDRVIISSLLGLARLEGRANNDLARSEEIAARAEAVITRHGNPPLPRVTLLSIRGANARAASEWDVAITRFEEAWALRVKAGLDDVPGALNTLNALGMAYIHEDKLEEATAMAERTVELGARLLGDSHPNQGVTLAMLGRLSSARGRHQEAIDYFQRSRAIFVSSFGDKHPNVPAMDNALGLAFSEMGRLDESLAAYENALQGTLVSRGPQHLDVAAVHSNLGNLLRATGRPLEGAEHHESARAIKVKLLGEDHKEVGFAYDNLGDDYRVAEDYPRALEYYQRSIALFESTVGEDASALAYPLSGVGMVYLAQQNPTRALVPLSRAVELDTASDTDPEDAARAAFPLARALALTGELPRAVELAKAAEAGWATSEAANARKLAEVRAWLAANPQP